MPRNFKEIIQIYDPAEKDENSGFFAIDQDTDSGQFHAFYIDVDGEATDELTGPASFGEALRAIADQFTDPNPDEPEIIEGEVIEG